MMITSTLTNGKQNLAFDRVVSSLLVALAELISEDTGFILGHMNTETWMALSQLGLVFQSAEL